MDLEMESSEVAETSTSYNNNLTCSSFTFSKPRILSAPVNIFDPDNNSKGLTDSTLDKKNLFTFATPMNIPCSINQNAALGEYKTFGSYKPKISRNAFKPSAIQTLRDAEPFERLKRNSRSQISKGNIENSITCINVPKGLLAKTAAKHYFTAYGNILKITIRPKKQIITVNYATTKEAQNAYRNAGEYQDKKFDVQWTISIALPKSPTKKKDYQKSIVSNFLKDKSDEIKSELEAMRNLEYNTANDTKDGDAFVASMFPIKKGRAQQFLMPKSEGTLIKREKPIAKNEKHKTEGKISNLVHNASMEELQNIIRQVAITSEDKYKVLEARDRLMRLKQVKSHSLATAEVTSGTCPDMCPEKERLMRESRRQVAPYEQLEGSEYRINHVTAIKQYSRSSADQEEPMAHELRPVKSLKMTMSYLLHEIADLCDQEETNLAEWYHFLWDRTRGIRKDITQQELCCIDSVQLVEQCARFHIVCSERLCAEKPSVFDKKINSDNLTKCLQSLKYMYHDLRLKGIVCKNEPEFRAYIILLNLNNGNFMWDLQRLPQSIQKSPEVRFALEVYSLLESNNYCKFFKLVKKTTYLNACILLRYFNQVRVKALSVMVKAYCRTSSTEYRLYELTDILGFEDEIEAIRFCRQLGLDSSNDQLHILLNRQNFSIPILNMKQIRARNMIESKRWALNLSIGQCIAGGKMPEKVYKNHRPHNSFDQHGYLMPHSLNAEDQNATATQDKTDPYKFMEDVPEPETPAQISLRNQNLDFSLENEKQPASFNEQVKTFKQTPTSNSNPFTICKSTSNSAFELKSSTQETHSQPRILQRMKVEKQTTDNVPKVSGQLNKTIFTAKRPNETSVFGGKSKITSLSTQPETFSKQVNLQHMQNNDTLNPFLLAASKSIFSDTRHSNIFSKNTIPSTIFSSTSSMQVNPMSSKTVIAESRTTDSEKLPTVQQSTQVHQYNKEREENFEKEDLELIKIQRIEKDVEHIFNEIQNEVIDMYCSNIVEEDIEILQKKNIAAEEGTNNMVDEIVQEMCDSILTEIVNEQKLHEISLRMKNKTILKCFNAWKHYVLRKRQRRNALDDTPVWLQKHSIEESAKLLYSKEQDIVLCNMRKKQSTEKCKNPYANTLAPIEVVIHAGIKENLKTLDIDVHPNLYWKNKLVPIPLVFLLLGDGDVNMQNEVIMSDLETLLESGYVSEYTIMCEKNLTEKLVLNLTQSTILWLAVNKSPQNPLEMDYLRDTCDSCLSEELWLRILGDSMFNAKLAYALKEPNFVINLHNEAVTHLMDIVLDPESFMYTKFAPEFTKFLKNDNYVIPCSYEYFDDIWKKEDYRVQLERVISSLILPQWRFSWPIEDRNTLCLNIMEYCRETLLNTDFLSSNVLTHLYLAPDALTAIDFPDVVLYIIKAKIESFSNDLKVIYNKNHIKHFRNLPWWFKSNVLSEYRARQRDHKEISQGLEHPDIDAPIEKKRKLTKQGHNDYETNDLSNQLDPLELFCKSTEQQVMDVYTISDKIENQLRIQLYQNQLFEDRLCNALFDESSV
ncbi:hypothetical protein KM043_004663 [Ampulex compressa]|nr:hypothetical protein KM043_004663 [Ampulex compressa]